MKRLGRRLFNIGVVVSVMLFIAAVVLWARSYRHSDFVHLTISTPTLVPITSEAQREAQEQVRQTQGWAGVYTSRYIATAAAKGNWYFLAGSDAESVRDVSRPPPRFKYGNDSSGFLLPDASITALERSGLPGLTISNKNWGASAFYIYSLDPFRILAEWASRCGLHVHSCWRCRQCGAGIGSVLSADFVEVCARIAATTSAPRRIGARNAGRYRRDEGRMQRAEKESGNFSEPSPGTPGKEAGAHGRALGPESSNTSDN